MQEFEILKNNIERFIYQLSISASDIYSQKCNQNNAQCNVKYFDQCKGVDESICFIGLPKISQQCKADGRMISKSCGIRFPNHLNISSLTNDQKLFVCASHQIDDDFVATKENFLNQIDRVYMATYFDYFRVYPGEKIHECIDYIPSQRLWYLQATTGSKNMIIIIDISSAQYLPKIKQAVKDTIKTLSFNDFIGIIIMRNQSKILIEHKISRATEQMKNTLINSVNSLVEDTSQQQVNYEKAFQKVNQMLSKTFDYYGAPCQYSSNIILLLTSKAPTAGFNTSQSLSQIIGQSNNKHKIKLFTFGFGETLNPNLLKSLSCRFQGASFSYTNLGSVNLVEDIRIYQKFLSATVNNNYVTWTQPYRDYFTRKLMITAVIPIYYFQGQHRKKIGAIATDVLMQNIQNDTIGQDKVRKQLLKCPLQPVVMDKCIIQNLRPENSKCGIQNCNKNTKSTCTWTTSLDNIFPTNYTNYSTTTNNSCCPQQHKIIQDIGFVGLIAIVVLLLIGIIFVIIIKRQRRLDALQELNNQTNQQLQSTSQSQQSQN